MNKKILAGLCALFMLSSIQGNTNTNNSYKENITPDRSKVPAFPGADSENDRTGALFVDSPAESSFRAVICQ